MSPTPNKQGFPGDSRIFLITAHPEAIIGDWEIIALSPTVQDLAGTNKLLFTQEFLGEMLGVRRTSVTEVAVVLQGRGLIHYHRGKIEITNLDGLRKASCECYSAVRSHYELLIGTTYEDAQMR